MMKKDHFKQDLLLWPQVPFNFTETIFSTSTSTNKMCKISLIVIKNL